MSSEFSPHYEVVSDKPKQPEPGSNRVANGRYDVVWVFDLDSTGGYCFYEEPQLLLKGDKQI